MTERSQVNVNPYLRLCYTFSVSLALRLNATDADRGGPARTLGRKSPDIGVRTFASPIQGEASFAGSEWAVGSASRGPIILPLAARITDIGGKLLLVCDDATPSECRCPPCRGPALVFTNPSSPLTTAMFSSPLLTRRLRSRPRRYRQGAPLSWSHTALPSASRTISSSCSRPRARRLVCD